MGRAAPVLTAPRTLRQRYGSWTRLQRQRFAIVLRRMEREAPQQFYAFAIREVYGSDYHTASLCAARYRYRGRHGEYIDAMTEQNLMNAYRRACERFRRECGDWVFE